MPDLMQELSGLSVGQAALWGGYLTFTYAAMQFLFSPTVGNLSDRYGRRPVLLISLATLGVDYIVMALAQDLWLLFIGRAIAGIAGATYSTATAYIADVTPKDKRAAAFGLVGAGFGVGFVLGPVIGGLMGELGTRAPFYAAAAVAFANFLYGWLVLPESLAPENRRPFQWARANPLGAVAQISKLQAVAWFVAVSFLYSLSHWVYPAVWSYYTKEAFAWSNAEIGLSLAFIGIGFAVVQGGLIRIFLKRLGAVRTAYLGFVFNMGGMIAIAMATQGWMIYALMPIIALGDIVKPALTGLMSNAVGDDAQGELQGVLASSQGLTTILSPVMMTQVFGAFTSAEATLPYFPGAPFLLAAVVMAIAMVPFAIGLSRAKVMTA
jgi:DHA1 family tetracycline resistance protein-like MFS transporter